MTLAALSWVWLSEPIGRVNNGLGWDGRHYAALYSYFSSGKYLPIAPEFPYTQRVGLPFLAARLPLSARQAFLMLHGIFWSATMVLFAICCRTAFRLKSAGILFGVLWLQLVWLSIPRGTAAYPFTVDSAALFFIQAWILVLLTDGWRMALPLVAFVGVLFKETVLLIALLSSLALVGMWIVPRTRRSLPRQWIEGRRSGWVILALACLSGMAAKWVAVHVLPPGHLVRGSEVATIVGWLTTRVQQPWQPVRYVAAVFAVYGGFAVLRAATLGKARLHEQGWAFTFALALCPLYLVVCFFAGSDLTKFAFMAFPFALPVLLVEFQEVSTNFAVLALLLGLPAAHAFGPMPAPAISSDLPSQDLYGLYSWMMEYAHIAIVGSWIAWWLGCIRLLRSAGFSREWRSELLPAIPDTD